MTQKFTMVKNGKTYGDYTVCQISRMLAEGQKTVREAVQNGTEICGYTLDEAQTAENENLRKKVLEKYDWDKLRLRINPWAERGQEDR